MRQNPFFELYVGEKLSADDFVTIFSPFLVEYAAPLFLGGNVVVTGVQGSGKSMLLSLLKPDVRMMYREMGVPFPVPQSQRKFLSASVNLALDNLIDFGYRKHNDDVEFLFADFMNYTVVRSFLTNIKKYYAYKEGEICAEVGLIAPGPKGLSKIALAISSLDVWDGWVKPTESIDTLIDQLVHRAKLYTRFLNKKDKELQKEIYETRTTIGEPILACVAALLKSELIDKGTNVFVDVDQYEELNNVITGDVNIDYRAVVNRALANRNPLVSYRIGTRGHAWRTHSRIMGTIAKLEEERDYKYVDLDLMLRRFEDSRTDIFPKFVEDIFFRRLKFSIGNLPESAKHKILNRVYGSTPNARDKAKALIREPNANLVKGDKNWRPETIEGLRTIAARDPISAVLGEAWVRQKGDEALDLNVRDEELPWNKQKYWRKERDQVALLQVASRARQQLQWSGGDDIVVLSGGNALVFLSLNQFIWDTWLQSGDAKTSDNEKIPSINPNLQAQAIRKASDFWVRKINQETGRSSERSRFVLHVSSILQRKLIQDTAMSNPGHNGFSILQKELEENVDVYDFLRELSDYGNCLMGEHTTKNKDGRPRKKWYFNPVFCPHFGLPAVRTKEPYYATMKDAVTWLNDSGFKVKFNRPKDDEEPLLL